MNLDIQMYVVEKKQRQNFKKIQTRHKHNNQKKNK